MILKNKFYYSLLLLLLLALVSMDVYSFRVDSSYSSLFVLLVHLTFFIGLLLKQTLAKPLLKIWLIAFIGIPILVKLGSGLYTWIQSPSDLSVDFLWASIRLFIVALILSGLDTALKIRQPSKVFAIKRRTKYKVFRHLPAKYPGLSFLYLKHR